MESVCNLLKNGIRETILESFGVALDSIGLEYPNVSDFGDLSTNVALKDFQAIKHSDGCVATSSLELAEQLKLLIEAQIETNAFFSSVAKVAVVSPGFINFFFRDDWVHAQLPKILAQGATYGSPDKDIFAHRQETHIQVEFVSANPTGPLHIGNTRGGPLGDTLANILSAVGYSVEREYYHNDVGGQVKKLGESLLHWYAKRYGQEVPFPEEGYQGEYVKELASSIDDSLKEKYLTLPSEEAALALGKYAVEYFLSKSLLVCEQLGIRFDKVTKESDVIAEGWTSRALKLLEQRNFVKKADGATWFAASDDYMSDRECVLIKSNGEYTYFSNDIGYHLGKFERGFNRVLDIWGANHHGHVSRMKSAMGALGIDPKALDVLLYQWVRVSRGGELISMSKRKGSFVLAEEVLTEIGKEAFRFSFLLKDSSTPVDFDLELLSKKTEENPVYYVQYAHARMANILSKFKGDSESLVQDVNSAAATTPYESRLACHLIKLPDLLEDISQTYAVHKLANYALELADLFHSFYEHCRVLGEKQAVEAQRLLLVKTSQVVLKRVLDLLGVEAPERM